MKLVAKIVLAAIGGVVCATSCNVSKNGSADIENIEISEQIKNYSSTYMCNGGDSLTVLGDSVFGCRVSASVQWLEKFGSNDLSELHDSILSVAFGITGSDIDEAMRQYGSQVEDLLYVPGDALRVADKAEVDSAAVVFYNDVAVRIESLTEQLVVYRVENVSYTGGAHRNYDVRYINYDALKNKVITFDDIFAPGSDARLLQVIEKYLCSKYGVASLQVLERNNEIFEGALYVSRNVYITDQGVAFFYNAYDIAPWSMGSIAVHVPFYELEACLSDEALAIVYPNLVSREECDDVDAE